MLGGGGGPTELLNTDQPRSKGLFPGLGAGREKALGTRLNADPKKYTSVKF